MRNENYVNEPLMKVLVISIKIRGQCGLLGCCELMARRTKKEMPACVLELLVQVLISQLCRKTWSDRGDDREEKLLRRINANKRSQVSL